MSELSVFGAQSCNTLIDFNKSFTVHLTLLAMASSLRLCALPASPSPSLRSLSLPRLSAFRPLGISFPRRRVGAHGGGCGGACEEEFDIGRLEQYTEQVPNEVLRVHAVVDGEEDQVLIFKGFSSSLMRPTAFDPAEPVLPPSATIRAIDRIRGPYNSAKVLLIKGGRGLTWHQFQALLQDKGL